MQRQSGANRRHAGLRPTCSKTRRIESETRKLLKVFEEKHPDVIDDKSEIDKVNDEIEVCGKIQISALN